MPHHYGRKLLLRDETVRNAIITSIKCGLNYKDACIAAGIDESSFYYWKQLAEDSKGKERKTLTVKAKVCLDFFEEVKIAQAAGKDEALKTIKVHSRNNWCASAWMLERRFPDEYALRARSDEIRRHVQTAFGTLTTELALMLTEFVPPDKLPTAIEKLKAAVAKAQPQ